jgi:hypothetical protein
MSAAPYAHQWHTKPNTFGLNLSPVVIRSQLLLLYDLFLWKRRINLAQDLFIGKVL